MKIWKLAVTLAVIAAGGKGAAHEFWIDPTVFAVGSGEAIEAQLRVGEAYLGAAQPYLPRNFARFDVVSGDLTRQVQGRMGDIPALIMAGLPDGLAVVVHETAGQNLTWPTWERFVDFAAHKDLGDVAAMQDERGLDREGVRELYFRYAKSLIAVGEGAGGDARMGLRTEIVALANPYTDDLTGGVPVQLWLDDAVRADEQVEIFERAPDGTIVITTQRTDADGIARVPVRPGHDYMVDAVTLEPSDPFLDTDPEWVTLWANLTFSVPQ